MGNQASLQNVKAKTATSDVTPVRDPVTMQNIAACQANFAVHKNIATLRHLCAAETETNNARTFETLLDIANGLCVHGYTSGSTPVDASAECLEPYRGLTNCMIEHKCKIGAQGSSPGACDQDVVALKQCFSHKIGH